MQIVSDNTEIEEADVEMQTSPPPPPPPPVSFPRYSLLLLWTDLRISRLPPRNVRETETQTLISLGIKDKHAKPALNFTQIYILCCVFLHLLMEYFYTWSILVTICVYSYLCLTCSTLTRSIHQDSAQRSHCAPVGPDGCWYMHK